MNKKLDEMDRYDEIEEDNKGIGQHVDGDYLAYLMEYGDVGYIKDKLAQYATSDSVVLDLGCGDAQKTIEFLRHHDVKQVVGIDISRNEILKAKEDGPKNLELSWGDAERLPYTDDSFDIVLSSATLHHLPDWDGAVLDEISRVLSADGVLIFRDPLKYNPPMMIYRAIFEDRDRTDAERPLDPTRVREELHERFGEVELEGHYLFSPSIAAVNNALPISISPKMMYRAYNLEKPVLNTIWSLSAITTGVAKNPQEQ